MPKPCWHTTDELIELIHCPDHRKQVLLYARIYTAGQGYSFSDTNQLVLNLKMSPNAPAQRLRYKRQAIRQFVQEVISLLQARLPPERSLTLVPMPPSKDRSHPEYDDRMEQVAEAIAAQFGNVNWLPLLYSTRSIESFHSRMSGRSPDELYPIMQLDVEQAALYRPGSTIALLDDVLTSGAHYTAARRRLLEAFPDERVIGIFWAKAVTVNNFVR